MDYHLLRDLGYFSGGILADAATTWYGARKYGAECESNIQVRKTMEQHGPGKGLALEVAKLLPFGLIGIAGIYTFDTTYSNARDLPELHWILAYGFGTIPYMTAAGNMASINGYQKTSKILKSPLRLLERIMARNAYDK